MKDIILFGCGAEGYKALMFFTPQRIRGFCDNRTDCVECYEKEIIPFDEIVMNQEKYLVVVSANPFNTTQIVEQMEKSGIEDWLPFCFFKEESIFSLEEYQTRLSKEIQRATFRKNYYKRELEKARYQVTCFKKYTDISGLKPISGKLREQQMKLLAFLKEVFLKLEEENIRPFAVGGTFLGAVRHKGFVPWDDDMDFGLIRNEYNALIELFRKKNCVYEVKGTWVEQNGIKEFEQMGRIVRERPGELILFVWPDILKLARGTSEDDIICIDFFSFDYYADGFEIEQYVDYLNKICNKQKEINDLSEIKMFLEREIKNNPVISEEETTHIGIGIDHTLSFSKVKWERSKQWLLTKQIYPLKEYVFEETSILGPNNADAFLTYEYGENYMDYPNDVWLSIHEENRRKYMEKRGR